MNIAVISNHESQIGVSSLVVMLSSIFASVQKQRVALFSTGDMKEIFKLVETQDFVSAVKSPSVYKAMMLSSSIRDDEVWDYAYRIGSEEVFAFDVYSENAPVNEQIELFQKSFARVKSIMQLVEVKGDLNSDVNKFVLDNADCIVYVFAHSPNSLDSVKKYYEEADPKTKKKCFFVCQKFNGDAVSEKKLSKMTGVDGKLITQVPYSPVIISACLEGNLNEVANLVVTGHFSVVNLRMKFYEIMASLYDTGTHKIIKEVREWGR